MLVGNVLFARSRWAATCGAVLINADRVDRPTFWQRSQDDWVVGVVMLLLGGVLGYLINQIT